MVSTIYAAEIFKTMWCQIDRKATNANTISSIKVLNILINILSK